MDRFLIFGSVPVPENTCVIGGSRGGGGLGGGEFVPRACLRAYELVARFEFKQEGELQEGCMGMHTHKESRLRGNPLAFVRFNHQTFQSRSGVQSGVMRM